ncbi:glycosyltransferase [Arthrobacter psychrolactophilus]
MNLPKDSSLVQKALLNWVESRTAFRIVLNPSTVLPADQARALVIHGHYREWFSDFTKPAAVTGRIGYFGLIRRYKRVDRLISAFRQTAENCPELSLHIAGRPSSDNLTEQITALSHGDTRIHLSLRFQTDAELAHEVGESQLIVLPYEDMHNSGGVLTALSLGRPVLVPANAVNRELSKEVGSGWVQCYSGPLTGDVILAALADVRRIVPGTVPNLNAREWDGAGLDHLAIYLGMLDR